MENNKQDRMEDMLSNLITMVGNLNQKVQSIHEENAAIHEKLNVMEDEQQSFKRELSVMICENKKQFTDIKSILTDMQADQEHIWEKAARNERELAKFKKHLQL